MSIGTEVASYKKTKHTTVSVFFTEETGFFHIYSEAPNSGWLFEYRAKDFLKVADRLNKILED